MGKETQEIKFREPLFNKSNEFHSFHYWGFINGEFRGPANLKGIHQRYTGIKDREGNEIRTVSDIDTETEEGKLLVAAIGELCAINRKKYNLPPEGIIQTTLEELNHLAALAFSQP